jgi:hypothetical protein
MFFRSKEDKAVVEGRRGEIEAGIQTELKQNGFSVGTEMFPQVDLHFEIIKNP